MWCAHVFISVLFGKPRGLVLKAIGSLGILGLVQHLGTDFLLLDNCPLLGMDLLLLGLLDHLLGHRRGYFAALQENLEGSLHRLRLHLVDLAVLEGDEEVHDRLGHLGRGGTGGPRAGEDSRAEVLRYQTHMIFR